MTRFRTPQNTMKSNRTALTVAATAALFAAFGTAARATEAPASQPTTEELMAKIEALSAQVEQLQDKQEATTRQLSAEEVDSAVDRVLTDAERRSEMLSMQGFTAGWNKGFILQSDDGAFQLNPNFQFQFRFVENLIDGDDEGFDDIDDIDEFDDAFDDFESEEGFEIRRMKFGVKGTMFTENLEYNFKWGTDRSGGALVLEDAEIFYAFADNWALHVGQFKDPVHFEETTSSSRQMAVDRSLVNELLGGGLTDRIQGVGLMYESDTVRGELVVHDGINTDNTNYTRSGGNSFVQADAPQWGVASRVEFVAIGDGFGGSKDFATIAGNGVDGGYLVFGVGADLSDFGDEWAAIHTGDVLYKSGEGANTFSLFGAYYGIYTDTQDDSGYSWGLEAQGAYAFTEKLDAFLRAGFINGDDKGFFDDDYLEFTIGTNYYFVNHAAKVTIDATYLPDGSPVGNSGIGVVGADEQDQIIFRGQFQLMI